MRMKPVAGILLRQFYLLRGSPVRSLPMFAWVAIDIVVWGFITRYLNSMAAGRFNYVPSLLGAVLMWDFFTRIMQGVSTAFLEDVWSRNFLNLFATPLTISEYILGLVYGIPELGLRVRQLLREFDLERLRDTRTGVLSSGEQTRVALAKAVLNRPRLLLLDEPTASLDPAAAQTIRARIRSLALESGCGILWTSHNMYEVEEVCDRVLFLSRGRILLEGDPRHLPREHGAATLEELFIRLAREPLAEPLERAG